MVTDAIVLEVFGDRLLVRDLNTNEEIMVLFDYALRFFRGDFIRIISSGQSTLSIPPQITAISVQSIPRPVPPAPPAPPAGSVLTAVVLQTRGGSLLVRELNTNTRFIVETPRARFFRPGQRITVEYETIFLNEPPNPSRIIATNIR